jgi:predicted porin
MRQILRPQRQLAQRPSPCAFKAPCAGNHYHTAPNAPGKKAVQLCARVVLALGVTGLIAPAPWARDMAVSRVGIEMKLHANLTQIHQSTKENYVFKGNFLKALFPNDPTTTLPTATRLDSHKGNWLANVNRSKLSFYAEGSVNNLKIKPVITLSGDGGGSRVIKEAYIAIKSTIFEIMLGNHSGVEDKLVAAPSDLAFGSGGTDGCLTRALNPTTLVSIYPSMTGVTNEATKISLYTARIAGIQFGASFTPDTKHYGESTMNVATSGSNKPFQVFDVNSMALGANLMVFDMNKAKLNLSYVHLRGKTKAERPDVIGLGRKNTRSHHIGGVFSYNGMAIGGELILNGKSHCWTKNIDVITPVLKDEVMSTKKYLASAAGGHKIINLGIGYSTPQGGMSVTWLTSTRRTGITNLGDSTASSKAKGHGIVVSTEYIAAPGIAPYVEYGYYKMKNPDWAYIASGATSLTQWEYAGTPSNKANIVLMGIKVQF